jgi:hypothetical protein
MVAHPAHRDCSWSVDLSMHAESTGMRHWEATNGGLAGAAVCIRTASMHVHTHVPCAGERLYRVPTGGSAFSSDDGDGEATGDTRAARR